jgi:hypothetical protein
MRFKDFNLKYSEYKKKLQNKSGSDLPKPDLPSPKTIKTRISKKSNYTLELILQTILVFLIIDGSIYCYFKYYKKVPLVNGLNEWGQEIVRIFNFSDEKPIITFNKIGSKATDRPFNKHEIEEKIAFKQIKKKDKDASLPEDKVYTWKDSNGNIHASNAKYPENNETLKELEKKDITSQKYFANLQKKSKKNTEKYQPFFYKIHLISGGSLDGQTIVEKKDTIDVISKSGMTFTINKNNILKKEKIYF